LREKEKNGEKKEWYTKELPILCCSPHITIMKPKNEQNGACNNLLVSDKRITLS
jgi:hypothetical protein